MNSPVRIFHALVHPDAHEGKVSFKLSGSASDYNLTYKCDDDHAVQVPHARKNWRYSFNAREGDYVYFSAQANEPGTRVQVKIVYKGKTFKESKAGGDYALALAGGCLC
jgi:hypothetical protein